MNPNLLEQFLGPSTQFFCFNSNDINVLVTPIDKKTCLLTKRNVITTTKSTNLKSSSSYNEKSRSTTRLNSSKSADLNSSFSSTASTAKINQSTPKLTRKNSFRTTKITIKDDKKSKTTTELSKDESTTSTDKCIADLNDETNKSNNDDECLNSNIIDKEEEQSEEENLLNRTYDEVSTDLDKTELPHIDSNDYEECKFAHSALHFCSAINQENFE
jgi:hypothetical protein